MKLAWIRVRVGGRHAGSTRWATFTAAHGRVTFLAVDERDLDEDRMLVGILDENGDELVIRLPRAGLEGEWAAVVPRASVMRQGTAWRVLAWVLAVLLTVAALMAVVLVMVR